MVDYERICTCPECGQEVKRGDMEWVTDRYGIPYQLVCRLCEPIVRKRIRKWRFDPADAGEELEPVE
jgi:predicted 3-demethylubiquinone-9 3-methyltransferase (glyoxalase superfamily)